MADALKPVLARQMEVYAGFLEHTDHHVGRLLDALDDLGILDNTLVYYIIGDNGASAEGTLQGTFNEMVDAQRRGRLRDHRVHGVARRRVRHAAGLQPLRGRLGARDEHPVPVDQAGRLALGRHPQRHHRALAGRDRRRGRGPQPVHPRHRRRRRRCWRPPGCREPTIVNGVQQRPHGGHRACSTASTTPTPPNATSTQYFEMFGNRGIYHKGWTAVTKHRTPVGHRRRAAARFDDDVWELYDTSTDWTQAHDLADRTPRETRMSCSGCGSSKRPSTTSSRSTTGRTERINPDIAGRPHTDQGQPPAALSAGMGRLNENSVINMKNKSHAITADVDVPEGGADGVIIAQGGMVRRLEPLRSRRRPRVLLQLLRPAALLRHGRHRADRRACTTCVPTSPTTAADWPRADYVTLLIDGMEVGAGRVDRTEPILFSADETCDLAAMPDRPSPMTIRPVATGSPDACTGSTSIPVIPASTPTPAASTSTACASHWAHSERRLTGRGHPCS